MSDCANGLRGNFNFPTSLFRVSTVSGFLASYRHILKQLTRLTAANSCNIGDISAVDEDSYCDLKAENRVRVRPLADRGMTLHESFENEAEISEQKVSLVYQNTELTYRELNERSNKLAHCLQSLTDIKPDNLIALFTDKTEQMITSILAIWKLGAAYVPIDPNYPNNRIQYILEDTEAKIIVADYTYGSRMKEIGSTFTTVALQK
jgi:N-(5-amino-5-carboxypentanoyl)-L-cysteinyl-D-valine synthase